MFGLGVDDTREISVVPRCEIPLPHLNGRSGIVFVTGPSGSGKSTILKLIADTVERDGLRRGKPLRAGDTDRKRAHDSCCLLLRFDQLPELPDVPLVDVFQEPGMTLARTMMLLSVAGLNEAFVMLRRPSELSDGQRYRLRLVQVMAMVFDCISAPPAQDLRLNPTAPGLEVADCGGATQLRCCACAAFESAVVIADEFGSTLDRITAKTIARNLRRWLTKHSPMPMSVVCATTHDDLLEALEPDVLVWKGLGEELEVATR